MREKEKYYETDRAGILFLAGITVAGLSTVGIALGILKDPIALLPCIPVAVLAFFMFFFQQRERRRLCRDLETVSRIMVAAAENTGDLPEIEYKQGQMGLVYTDLQKLSTVLQCTRSAALQDRIYLKNTISDISHQLKTPLASMKLFIELLAGQEVTEEKRQQLLTEAGNQVERMEWLILALLKQARIEAGAVTFEKKDCDVKQILDTAIAAVNYLTEPRGQRVKTEISAKEGPVVWFKGDGPWLTEVLVNLLKNASDYSDENAEILVRAEENDLFIRVSVTDYGKGIPQEAMAHIFDRFYRVDKSVNPNSVGIGLSLAKTIVEGMNGQITVRSVEGEYTCFRVTFFK